MQRYPHVREFTRVLTHLEVTLFGEGGLVVEGLARDVALRGVYVEARCELREGSLCDIEIRLAQDLVGPKIQVKGSVTRVDPEGVAIEFQEIPLDSMDHLRGLLLYNAQDPDQVAQEFDSHIGLNRRRGNS